MFAHSHHWDWIFLALPWQAQGFRCWVFERQSNHLGLMSSRRSRSDWIQQTVRVMSWVLAPVEGLWGVQGPPGQAGPSYPLGWGADRGEPCGSLAMGLWQPSPGTGMCMGPWQPPLENPFVPLGLISRGDISHLCQVSEPRLQEGNLKHVNLHNRFDETLKLQWKRSESELLS